MSNLSFNRVGLFFETHFQKAIPYSDGLFRQWGVRALERFGSAGLAPSAIVARPADRVFGYNFSFQLGKAAFKVTAQKLEVTFLDAISKVEAQGLFQFLHESMRIFGPSPDDVSTFQLYAHAAFKTEDDRKEFIKTVPLPEGVSLGGVIAYSFVEGWGREIRLQIDKSNAIKDGLFIIMGTTIQGLITPEIVTTVFKSFEKLISRMGINVIGDLEQ